MQNDKGIAVNHIEKLGNVWKMSKIPGKLEKIKKDSYKSGKMPKIHDE